MITRRNLVGLAALSLTLAACDSTTPTSGSSTSASQVPGTATASPPASASASPDANRSETRTVPVGGSDATFEVGPAVRRGQTVAVRVQASTTATEAVGMGARWGAGSGEIGLEALVLVDPASGVVYRETSGRYVDPALMASEPIDVYATFGAVKADEVALYLPTVGVFGGIAVLEAGDAGAFDVDAALAGVEVDSSVADPVAIETYSESFLAELDTSVAGDTTTVNLASDVLFDSDSSALSAQADASLQVVADQIAAASGGGSVTITGHTDDVDTDAYNQTLSEQRAQAVRDRLGQLVDLSSWSVSVVGKGESEPRVSGTTDEARAANRRVEITIEASEPAQDAAASTAELPAAAGPTATGAQGVDVAFREQPVHLSMAGVTRMGGYLVGDLRIAAGDQGVGSMLGSYLSTSNATYNQRKEDVVGLYAWSAWSLALLAGGNRVYPADYQVDGFHVPLSGVVGGVSLAAGEEIVIPVVWPDTGQDAVTLDLQSAAALGTNAPDNPFRLTDVPVTEA